MALLREVIGDVLRRARTSQGRTLREVSDSARVSLGYLSEVERGRKEASSELLGAICGALDVPMSRVLSDAGDEHGAPGTRGARRPDGQRRQYRRHHQGRHPPGRVDGGGVGPIGGSILEIGRKGVVICAEPISWQLEQAQEPVPGPADNDTKAE